MTGRTTYTRTRGGEENQTSEVCSALIAKSACSIEQGSDTVGLKTRSDNGRAPASGSSGSFSRLEKFLLAVCGFGTVVGITEERGEHSGGRHLGEDDAEGDCRRLDGR
jgi:hypothetical protein